MTKISLFKKIGEKFKSREAKLDIEQDNIEYQALNFDFYIPEEATLKALKNKDKLTVYQINDVLHYIKNNYYLEDIDCDVLMQFAGDWTSRQNSLESVQNRKQDAIRNLIKSLSAGEGINVFEALWLSDNIYADSDNVADKRIISKAVENGCPSLCVKIAKQNRNVLVEMFELKDQLFGHHRINFSK